ncbi:Thioesterase superfamily protein [Arthrobacter saudimassiliensis]|uniref:Thioesterase superfamily protein n=1 Tax=Arthrobacter saudimassiliensis TaxID=1461584 RepID=A0A078MSH0_9MICC|nr:Thioesterase superfamily protein [Arthrobacter saudimassiliensis]
MPVNRFPIQLRFGDEDANGHVNNVRYLQFLEDARVRLGMLPVPDGADGGGDGVVTFRGLVGAACRTFVARQEIEYLAPLTYRPEPVLVETWTTSIGTSSFGYGFRLTDDDGVPTYALAEATMVLVDAETGAPRRLSEAQRRVLASWQAGPVPFRRRPVAAGER